MKLQEMVRNAINTSNMSIEQIAIGSGLHINTLRAISRDLERKLNIDTIEKICAAMGLEWAVMATPSQLGKDNQLLKEKVYDLECEIQDHRVTLNQIKEITRAKLG